MENRIQMIEEEYQKKSEFENEKKQIEKNMKDLSLIYETKENINKMECS